MCDGSRNFLGSEFQNIGPATEKARRPYVVSRSDGITGMMAGSGTKMLSRGSCRDWNETPGRVRFT